MITITQQIITFLAAFLIVIRAEPILNRMSRCTPFAVRLAFHLLTIAAVAKIFSLLTGDVPEWSTTILATAVAALLICERDLRDLNVPTKDFHNDDP